MKENEVLIMSHEVLELSPDLAPKASANESKEGELCTIATTTVSDGATMVYPGRGPTATMAHEIGRNPN
jgi:hypothetical protein